jgi:hypothetical protein
VIRCVAGRKHHDVLDPKDFLKSKDFRTFQDVCNAIEPMGKGYTRVRS